MKLATCTERHGDRWTCPDCGSSGTFDDYGPTGRIPLHCTPQFDPRGYGYVCHAAGIRATSKGVEQ